MAQLTTHSAAALAASDLSGETPPDTATPLDFRFAGYGYQNWSMDGEPPILVNPKASLHSKLAWCWGEAGQIEDLAFTLSTHDNREFQRIGNLLSGHITPLMAMLDHIGESTCKKVES